MVYNVCLLVNLILGALSSEFHSTSSTSESPPRNEQWGKSEQKTTIMERAKLEGEKEIKNLLSYCGKFPLTCSNKKENNMANH